MLSDFYFWSKVPPHHNSRGKSGGESRQKNHQNMSNSTSGSCLLTRLRDSTSILDHTQLLPHNHQHHNYHHYILDPQHSHSHYLHAYYPQIDSHQLHSPTSRVSFGSLSKSSGGSQILPTTMSDSPVSVVESPQLIRQLLLTIVLLILIALLSLAFNRFVHFNVMLSECTLFIVHRIVFAYYLLLRYNSDIAKSTTIIDDGGRSMHTWLLYVAVWIVASALQVGYHVMLEAHFERYSLLQYFHRITIGAFQLAAFVALTLDDWNDLIRLRSSNRHPTQIIKHQQCHHHHHHQVV